MKQLVYLADTHPFDSPDYDGVLAKAVTTFIDHTREEEGQQFPLLKAKLTSQESDVRTILSSKIHECADSADRN